MGTLCNFITLEFLTLGLVHLEPPLMLQLQVIFLFHTIHMEVSGFGVCVCGGGVALVSCGFLHFLVFLSSFGCSSLS